MNEADPFRRLRWLALAAAVFLYALIVIGAVVRVTGSGLGCPDWPLCYGRLIPPPRVDAWIEYTHRWVAALSSVFVLATAIQAWRTARKDGWIVGPATFGLVALVVQVGLGGATVLLETPPWIVAIHLALALVVLGLQWVAAVAASTHRNSMSAAALESRSLLSRHAAVTLAAVFALLITGAVVRATGASASCGGWPLCDGRLWPAHTTGQIHMIHRTLALLVGAMVIGLAARLWRTPSSAVGARVFLTLAAVLVVAQVTVGVLTVLYGLRPVLVGLHVATGAALWSAMVIGTSLVMLRRELSAEPLPTRHQPRATIKDFLALTKPAILLLLLFTTLAGMVVGAGGWPDTSRVLWTLVGGALAAGGASALNQYTDRSSDSKMARTQRRPIPAGRIGADQALAFGAVLCTAGFYVLALGINLLSAVLALAGMVYYVVLYGLVLKQATPHNIVIGGGAGAVPLLVGWAAGTGTLTMGAFLLFVLVFFWTPAHFWALALVRKADYRQAGIPMLPVVTSEPTTRTQIVLYSAQVVTLTLLIGAVSREGWFYFGSSLALGVLLLFHAWLLWRDGSARRAWRMYRFSSLYLALFFAALMINTMIGG